MREYLAAETGAWFVGMCVQGESVFSVQSSGSDSACCYCLQDSQTTGSKAHTRTYATSKSGQESHKISHTLSNFLHTKENTHADLSALCAEGRLVGECVSWRMCDDAHATGKRRSTRGQGELSLTSPRHASTHRACCGQRV